jgi:tetratricopeptide (TPR) repeat protein
MAVENAVQSNCQICANWNPRIGCVLGHNQALDHEVTRLSAVEVARKQALAWVDIGRLNRAIYRLERVLKDHPDCAEAYLELAKLYDLPSYQGVDKRRAIALYQRFVELRGAEGKDEAEVLEAQRRIPTLLRLPLPVPRRAEDDGGPVLATFTCFYCFGSLTHLAYGMLTPYRLVLARVGDADPESGRAAVEMGERAERSTRFLRWMAGEEAREREVRQTRHELERVSLLPPDAVARESRANVVLDYEGIHAVGLEQEDWRKACRVTVCIGPLHHDLVFPDSRRHQAEHCEALLKHLAGRKRPAQSGPDHEITPRSSLAGVSR